MRNTPLNGTKTHPLTENAIAALRSLVGVWRPRQEMNAGTVDRLERENLVLVEARPSPYRTHKPGTQISHVTASPAGVARVEGGGR